MDRGVESCSRLALAVGGGRDAMDTFRAACSRRATDFALPSLVPLQSLASEPQHCTRKGAPPARIDESASSNASGHHAATVMVALVQIASNLGEITRNVAKLEDACRRAAAGGAKIIVLPETAITGYLSQDLAANWQVPGRPLAEQFDTSKMLPCKSTRRGGSRCSLPSGGIALRSRSSSSIVC